MKVYVDIDDTRKITTYQDGLGTQQGLYVYGKDKIEVLSLTDYTKQVRKEVCEEIRKQIIYYPVSILDEAGKAMGNVWGISMKEFAEILDQIQGETK